MIIAKSGMISATHGESKTGKDYYCITFTKKVDGKYENQKVYLYAEQFSQLLTVSKIAAEYSAKYEADKVNERMGAKAAKPAETTADATTEDEDDIPF